MDNKKLVRQATIVSIFLLGLGFIYLINHLLFASPGTCTDKIQNQGEKGVDCGGPCAPCKNLQVANIAIQEKTFVFGGNGTYDVLAKVYNPNDAMGAQSFDYTFALKDSNGAILATKKGTNFVLPMDTKYVIDLGVTIPDGTTPAVVDFTIANPNWKNLGNLEKPQLGVYNKKFDAMPSGVGNQASGFLRNESNYDLNKITLVIVLRDGSGKVLGVNTTEKDVVRIKEQRDFSLNWPYKFDGTVQKMEVDAQSNILDPTDFAVNR